MWEETTDQGLIYLVIRVAQRNSLCCASKGLCEAASILLSVLGAQHDSLLGRGSSGIETSEAEGELAMFMILEGIEVTLKIQDCFKTNSELISMFSKPVGTGSHLSVITTWCWQFSASQCPQDNCLLLFCLINQCPTLSMHQHTHPPTQQQEAHASCRTFSLSLWYFET